MKDALLVMEQSRSEAEQLLRGTKQQIQHTKA